MANKKESFLERNKKKSLLALLLLLLRRRGPVIALLLISLLMLAFIGPRRAVPMFVRALDGLPVIGKPLARQAARVLGGEEGLAQGAGDFSALREAWRSAREKGSDAWNLFSDRGRATKGAPLPDDSVAMVRGSKSDLFGTAKDGSGRSVSGILSRDTARERGSAVELSQDDLQGQRADYVEATMGGLATGAGEGAGQFFAGFGPFTSRAFFKGENPATEKAGNLQSALTGSKVPPANRQKAENQGKMSNPLAAPGMTKPHVASNHTPARGNMAWRSLAQLGDTRAYAMLAKDPLCKASTGCPPEYASTNTALTYDGITSANRQEIITSQSADSPKIDGIGVPNVNVPNDSNLDQYIAETNSIDSDAAACRTADQYFGPQESAAMSDYLAKRDSACNAGCPRDAAGNFDVTGYFSPTTQACYGDASGHYQQAQSYGICCAIPILSSFCCPNKNTQNNYGNTNTGYANYYNQCVNLVGQVEAACDTLDNLRRAHYSACPIQQKDGAFQARCKVPPDAGGYQIPTCTTPTTYQPQCF